MKNMKEMQKDEEERKKIDRVGDLSRREAVYRMVFYTMVSPQELNEDLIIKLDRPKPTTQEEKREFKLAEIDTYKNACLQAYNELCDLGVAKFDLKFLMENGFGLGAGDLLNDEDVDKLIAKDEQIEQMKLKGKTVE